MTLLVRHFIAMKRQPTNCEAVLLVDGRISAVVLQVFF